MADRLLIKKTNITNTTGAVCMDGVSGDSQTVISITICEIAGADETFDVVHTVDGGSSPIFIYKTQTLPANATFVHNDKMVLTAGQKLGITASSGNTDVLVSYLDQEL